MAKFNGIVTLEAKDVEVNSKEELANAFKRIIDVIADQASQYKGTPKDTAVTGQVSAGPSGQVTGGSVTVTTGGNSGSVSGTVSVGPGGQPTGGTVSGTFHF